MAAAAALLTCLEISGTVRWAVPLLLDLRALYCCCFKCWCYYCHWAWSLIPSVLPACTACLPACTAGLG